MGKGDKKTRRGKIIKKTFGCAEKPNATSEKKKANNYRIKTGCNSFSVGGTKFIAIR